MNEDERKYLHKYMTENKVEDTTEKIRATKQSDKLKNDVVKLLSLRRNIRNTDRFRQQCERQCFYLKTHQKKLYEKLLENQNKETLAIVDKMLTILTNIENGKIDQNEGSYEFGKLCKEIYVDPKINNVDDNKSLNDERKIENISWKQFKELKMK